MKLSAALCILCAAAPAGATNLIGDGDFEATPVEIGGYSHFAGNTSFDGGAWHVTGSDILLVDTSYHVGANPSLVFNAQSGAHSLDLTGTGNSGPDDGVYQDIVTDIGKQYVLSFFVGRASTTGSDQPFYTSPATMRLSIDGGAIREFVNSEMVTSGIAWIQFSQAFTAVRGTTRISFINGQGNDYLGLDNVSVFDPLEVPEPATFCLFVGGLGVMALSRRKVVAA